MKKPAHIIPRVLLLASVFMLSMNAHADIFGTATLDVGVRLLRADGTQFAPTDFSNPVVLHRGYLSFHNGFANTAVGEPATTVPELIDLPVTCIGDACPVSGENDFAPLPGEPGGFFSNADQRETGNLLAGDLRLQLRSDAGTQSFGAGHYGSNASTLFLFRFSPNQAGTITVEVDATPYVSLSRPRAITEPLERAAAGTELFFSLFNLTSNQRVFFFDDPLRELSRRFIESDYDLVDLIYDPDALTFSLTSPQLNAGDNYEFAFFAETFTSVSPAPEPSSLAMYGLGLSTLLLLQRRRRATS